MARRVKAGPGVAGLVLPRGWVLDSGDEVVIPDAEWDEIEADEVASSRIKDLGYTSEQPDEVPSYRDLQRAFSSGDAGLESQIEAVDLALSTHAGDTTNVHGIVDTAKLGWNQSVSVDGATNGDVLTLISGQWVGSAPAVDTDYSQEFIFASPAQVWTCNHGQGHRALSVETLDANNNRLLGEVTYPTDNQIQIEWYYPMSGKAIVHE